MKTMAGYIPETGIEAIKEKQSYSAGFHKEKA